MKDNRNGSDRMSRVFGQLGALTRNHLRIETAIDLPNGDILVGGWHPERGELVVSVGGASVRALRYPRKDVNDAMGTAPGTPLAFLALITPGESREDLTYQVAGMRRRDMYLRTRTVDADEVREQLVWIFDRPSTTYAAVADHFRPAIAALESGTGAAPSRLSAVEFALRYFDDEWYLECYGDVKDAGVDPFRHWLGNGRNEARNPHPLMDAAWYEREYGVPASAALTDYLLRGWLKSTSPSAFVDSSAVLREHGNVGIPLAWLAHELQAGKDVDTGALDTSVLRALGGPGTQDVAPLRVIADYVRKGWSIPWQPTWKGVRAADYLDDADWTVPSADASADKAATDRAPISVIVPVYGIGPAMDRCLTSVAETLGTDDEAIIVLDHPERLDWPVLDALSDDARWSVVITGGGAGFSGAVNAGAATAVSGNDLVILNSDAVVFPGTFDSFSRHALEHARAASICALSNQGSLASYPRASRGAPLVPGGTPAELAVAAAVANPGLLAQVPTTMGHCFWVRRSAWDEVGGLDAERFPAGYGEENEWSVRAAEHGWQHFVAVDTFVWHQGNASFGQQRAEELTRQGLLELERTHPGIRRTFMLAGEEYRASTEAAYARLDAARIAKAYGPTGVRRVLITHDMGGGIDEFIDREERFDASLDVMVLLSTKAPVFRVVAAALPVPSLDGVGIRPGIDMLREIVDLIGAQVVEVHSVVSHDSVATMEQVSSLETPMSLIQHDYFLACPRVTFFGGVPSQQGPNYCGGEKDVSVCHSCIGHWGSKYYTGDMKQWRDLGQQLHAAAADVWVPSVEADAVLTPFGLPGEPWEHCKPRAASGRRATPQVNVLVVGSISEAKGARVLREVAALNKLVDGPLVFGLMGTFDENVARYLQVFDVLYGAYDNTKLDRLEEQPAVVMLPSVWPETHLYTVDDALTLAPDATCAVFEVGGAQSRRAREAFENVIGLESIDPSYVYERLVAAVR